MIGDSRRYAESYPQSNIIISQALQVLDNKLSKDILIQTIAAELNKENDALINIALNLAPSADASRLIYQALNEAVNDYKADKRANFFALPLVLVAGSKTKQKICGQIDTQELNDFFTKHELFTPDSDCFISGKLIAPQQLAAIKYSQIYFWVRNQEQAKIWLPVEMGGSEIEFINEGVFLRFLIGVCIDKGRGECGLNVIKCNSNLMGLMRFIHKKLENKAITLFPIPYTPLPLSQAFAKGMEYRNEIAVSVALSNIVKKIRYRKLTPIAIISAHEDSVKTSIKSKEPSELREIAIFTMTKFADFDAIMHKITTLLEDMTIEWKYVSTSD